MTTVEGDSKMGDSKRRRQSTNRVAKNKGEHMSEQEQQHMDDQFKAKSPEEQFMEAEPVESGFSNPGFTEEAKTEDEWEDDESFLEDSTGRQMLYWIGGAVGVLVIIAVLFFFLGGGSEPTGDYSGVSKQVKDIESRLTKLESNLAAWNIKLDRIDQNAQTAVEESMKLSAKIEELRRQASSRPAPAVSRPAPAPAPAPTRTAAPAKSADRKYHVVQAGDTLYSIHKRYGVSLDALRKLNNLKEHEPIYSGDKIYVE